MEALNFRPRSISYGSRAQLQLLQATSNSPMTSVLAISRQPSLRFGAASTADVNAALVLPDQTLTLSTHFLATFPGNEDGSELESNFLPGPLPSRWRDTGLTSGPSTLVTLSVSLCKIFEIDSHQSRFTNLSECFLPKFMDNSFGESNCCPSGVPNSLVYGLQFCCPVGNRHPRLDGLEVSFTTPRKTASLKGRCFSRTVRSRHFSH